MKKLIVTIFLLLITVQAFAGPPCKPCNGDVRFSLIPDTDDTYDIGSSSKEFKDAYIDGTGYIDTISLGVSLSGENAAGPSILNEAATSTNPTLVPNKADPDTGVGWSAADKLSLITGGAEAVHIDDSQNVKFLNSKWLQFVDNAGTGTVPFATVGADDTISLGAKVNLIDPTDYGEDAGVTVSGYQFVSSSASDGTEQSSVYLIDGEWIVKLYSESDGTGGVDTFKQILRGLEGEAAILEMWADDGDDNADKVRIRIGDGGGITIDGYETGSWVSNVEYEFTDPEYTRQTKCFGFTPSSDQARLDDSTITIDNTITRVVGSGGAVVLDVDPAIENGAFDGQMIIIQGTSDANTVQIADNCNAQLAGAAAMTLGKGDTIQLIWDNGETEWYEVSRSDN